MSYCCGVVLVSSAISWVANSCAIYPLPEGLVPETAYVVSRHFSKAVKAQLLLRRDMPAKLIELVLCSYTFFTQVLINCAFVRLQEPLSKAQLSADCPCMYG